jgi:hypothetical protein
MAGVSFDQATIQVISHGLINTLACIFGEAEAVRTHLDDDGPAQPVLVYELLGLIQDQAQEGVQLLGDVMRGLPPPPADETGTTGTTGTIIRLP